jgi:hypothetical protein
MQQGHTATRTAIRKPAIATVTDLSMPDERLAHPLIHAHRRRRTGGGGTSPALLPGPKPSGACLSRLPGNGHGRFLGELATRRRYPTNWVIKIRNAR